MKKFRYLRKLKVGIIPRGLANMLSFHKLEQHHDVKTAAETFVVHVESVGILFKKGELGLPYIDLGTNHEELCFINTVRANYEGFTKAQIQKVKTTREAMAKIRNPMERKFIEMVHQNMNNNCPITAQDIANANLIFGRYLPGMRIKTTRTKPMAVKTEYISIPQNLIMQNKLMFLIADLMFADGVSYSHCL